MCGDKYQSASWRHGGGGWKHGHPGSFFFPPFALLFGFFLLFMLFKTGLWIPLLVLGLIFWGTRQHRGHWARHEWRDWQDWHRDDDEPEKPKRDQYI